MRSLRQPGPAPAERIESFAAAGRVIEYVLQPGLSLNEALTAPLVAAGLRAGAIVFAGAELAPFRYVLPGPARDPAHVAWFSDTHTPRGDPAGRTLVERANATFGWRAGAPFVHCHGVWIEPDGSRHGGHMLPEETFLAAGGTARAWATASVAIRVDPDAETNFPLFHPVPAGEPPEAAAGPRLILARLRPNQDLAAAIETLCRRHGLAAATVRGSLGSLIGARFADGREVADHATEVLVREGRVAPDPDGRPRATLDLAVVDMAGTVHEGALAAGENPVCITFELMLEAG